MELNENQKVMIKALCESKKSESVSAVEVENVFVSILTVLRREKARAVTKDGEIKK